MKKTLTLLITLTLLLTSCTTTAPVENSTDSDNSTAVTSAIPTTTLKDEGIKIIEELSALASNDNYANLYSTSDELVSIITSIGQTDYSTPTTIYEITGIAKLATQLSGSSDAMPDLGELQPIIEEKMSLSIAGIINGLDGVNTIAATSMLVSSTHGFHYEGLEEITTYIYEYPGDFSVIVTFIPEYNNIVLASGQFISNNFNQSMGSLSELATLAPLAGISIETIPVE